MNTSVFISEESAHLRHIHQLFPDSCCPKTHPSDSGQHVHLCTAIITLSSCGASHYLTTNANLQQTNVVLSQNNFHVVKNVESSVTAKYWFGIGGISKKALHENAHISRRGNCNRI